MKVGDNMDELNKARKTINEIDKKIAELFQQRLDAVQSVAQYKKEHHLEIFDKKREEEVLERNCAYIQNEDYLPYYRQFQQHLMDVSKAYQQVYINHITVGYQGIEGAFSHIATTDLFPNDTKISYPTFEHIFQAVENNELNYGVIPFENSYSGDVQEVLDLCRKYNCHVQEMYPLAVDQNLVVKKGTKLENITDVYSHPQAINQCQLFLKQRPWNIHQAKNTALAAKYVSEQETYHNAAIASKNTAKLYDLDILEMDIQNSRQNTTRFIVISKEPLQPKTHFSLIFTVPHKSGQLAKVINTIAKANYNMECIKSQPQKDIPWAYYFYMEIEGNIEDEKTKQLIDEIQQNCLECKILGSYYGQENQ